MNRYLNVSILACMFFLSSLTSQASVFTTDITIQGSDFYFDVELFEQAKATVIGGTIQNRLQLLDDSSAEISGGFVNALYLGGQATDRSTAKILSGAYINTYITTYGDTVLDIYGGRMPDNSLIAVENSRVNFHVLDYLYTPDGGLYGEGLIVGTWADNSTFNVSLRELETYSHISFHAVPVLAVPEPASFLVWSLFGLVAVGFQATKSTFMGRIHACP